MSISHRRDNPFIMAVIARHIRKPEMTFGAESPVHNDKRVMATQILNFSQKQLCFAGICYSSSKDSLGHFLSENVYFIIYTKVCQYTFK